MKRFLMDRAYTRYQRVGIVPSPVIIRLAAIALNSVDPARGQEFARRVAALELPPDPLQGQAPEPIELLIVSAPKDFVTLPWAIKSAVANAGHPITKIHLVVPDKARKAAEVACAGCHTALIEFSSDEAILSKQLRSAITQRFGQRSGWIAQQLLCIAGVYGSQAPRVLVLDADTILVRSRTLFAGDRQLLPVTLEHNEAYFEFLRQLVPGWELNMHSHIPHHMPQQPFIWRAIFEALGTPTFDEFSDEVLRLPTESVGSPISIDYELYAQGLLKLFPELAVEAKWANLSVCLQGHPQEAAIRRSLEESSSYYSLSFHNYNVSG